MYRFGRRKALGSGARSIIRNHNKVTGEVGRRDSRLRSKKDAGYRGGLRGCTSRSHGLNHGAFDERGRMRGKGIRYAIGQGFRCWQQSLVVLLYQVEDVDSFASVAFCERDNRCQILPPPGVPGRPRLYSDRHPSYNRATTAVVESGRWRVFEMVQERYTAGEERRCRSAVPQLSSVVFRVPAQCWRVFERKGG